MLSRCLQLASSQVIRTRAHSTATVAQRLQATVRTATTRRTFHASTSVRSTTTAPTTTSTLKQFGTNATSNVAQPKSPDELTELDLAQFEAATKAERGTQEHILALRQMASVLMSQAVMEDAKTVLMEALGHQEKIYAKSVQPSNFLHLVNLLIDLVANIRMSGIDPRKMDDPKMIIEVYEKAKQQLLQADPNYGASLEHPAVYTLICSISGCLIDGEQFKPAKELLATHLLHDLFTSPPSSTPGSYDLRDLRLASALNFSGMADFADHSACSGHGHGGEGGHAHHHHHHDHAAAEIAWKKAYTYTVPFTTMLRANKPVGQLDSTDQLMLQATSAVLDNLVQIAFQKGTMDDATRLSLEDVTNLAAAYLPYHPKLVASEATYLKVLLECQQMDEAEIQTEKMLAAFPHPKSGVNTTAKIPDEVSLEISRIYDDLSNVMFQFQNLDYAEKFLQISLSILYARLTDGQELFHESEGRPVTVHPALARAENALGLIQIQMKDYLHAEEHLKKGLEMKLQLAQIQAQQDADEALAGKDGKAATGSSSKTRDDGGIAEFYHNLALAQMGNKKYDEAEVNLLKARENYHLRLDEEGMVNLMNATYAGLCTHLTTLYRLKNDLKKALEHSKEAVRIKSQLFAPTSAQLIHDLHTTAHLHSTFKEFSTSIPLYKQLLTILERPVGRQAPDPANVGATYHWLALAYDQSNPREIALAVDAWRKAIVNVEKSKMGVDAILPLQRNLRRVLVEMELNQEVKELDETIAKNEAKQKEQQELAIKAAATATPKTSAANQTTSEEGAQFSQ